MNPAANHSERILEMLKGSTQTNPTHGAFLLAKTGLDPDSLNDVLDDLHGRGAINRATITKDGRTWTALWPTGIPPRALSWKQERDLGTGTSAELAHNVQAAAEASRKMHATAPAKAPVSHTEPAQEKPMPRIAKPAVVQTQKSPHARTDQQPNIGPVQTEVLAALADGGSLSLDALLERCPSTRSMMSLRKIVQRLAQRGLIVSTRLKENAQRAYYKLADAPLMPAEPLCSELPGNLATLRRIGADDQHLPEEPAIKPTRSKGHQERDHLAHTKPTSIPAAEPATEPAQTWADAVCGHIPTPLRDRHPRTEEHATFAFYDDGALEIYQGDETVMLQEKQVARLVAFLGRIAP